MTATGNRLDTVVITGLSGAGRSTAAKCFEDLGYYVVDNLPAELIATLMDLGAQSDGKITRLAIVMDVRSRAFTSDLRGVIRQLGERNLRPRVLLSLADDGAVAGVEAVVAAQQLPLFKLILNCRKDADDQLILIFERGVDSTRMTALTDALRGVAGVTAIQLGSAIRDASRPK